MQGKKDVIDILNEALKHELGAVNQYWLHYRMLENWGFTKLAKKERKESIEEMHHADKLVARIIFLEGLPNLQVIAPLMIGQNVKEVLECDLKGEFNARDLYTRAREICRKNEDLVSMQLFEELLQDEEGHIDFLETQLDLLDKIGVQNYGQLQADSADEVEGEAYGRNRRSAVIAPIGAVANSPQCAASRYCTLRLTSILAPQAQEVGGALGEEVAFRRLAVAVEQAPARGFQVEQQLAMRRVAHEAAHPADRRQPLAARHRRHAVQRGCGVGHDAAGAELECLLAGSACR